MQTSLISFIVRWRLDGEEIKNDGGMLRNSMNTSLNWTAGVPVMIFSGSVTLSE